MTVLAWLFLAVMVVAFVKTRRRRRRASAIELARASAPVDFFSPYRLPGRRRSSGRGF